jgi:hypothetical protein
MGLRHRRQSYNMLRHPRITSSVRSESNVSVKPKSRKTNTHPSSFTNSFFPPSVPANLKFRSNPFNPSGVNRPGNPHRTTFFPSLSNPPLGPSPKSPRSAASIRPLVPLALVVNKVGGGDEADVMGNEDMLAFRRAVRLKLSGSEVANLRYAPPVGRKRR